MAECNDTPQEPTVETGATPATPAPAIPAVTVAKSDQPHSPTRSHRFALLAASVAFAAACGGVIGSFGVTTAQRLLFAPAKTVAIDETQALKSSIAELASELGALKAGIEAASKGASGQFNRLSERIDRAERVHGEPAARLAKIAESLDRLERRVATVPAPSSTPVQETTGSAATPAAPAASKAPAESKAVAQTKEAAKPSIVAGWIIRDVYRGRIALLEDRHGIYEVEPGSNVPGVGRVESIKKQDGRWIVVTPKGLITSYR